MNIFEKLFKSTNLNTENKEADIKIDTNSEDIKIIIEGDINLFEDEKEKIIEGAKQLLELGKADDMEDAIKVFATIFRGLSCGENQKDKDGNTIIVLRETARDISDDDYER